jgi:hypothetical protein
MKKTILKTKLVLRKETIKALDKELAQAGAGRDATGCTAASNANSGCTEAAILGPKE